MPLSSDVDGPEDLPFLRSSFLLLDESVIESEWASSILGMLTVSELSSLGADADATEDPASEGASGVLLASARTLPSTTDAVSSVEAGGGGVTDCTRLSCLSPLLVEDGSGGGTDVEGCSGAASTCSLFVAGRSVCCGDGGADSFLRSSIVLRMPGSGILLPSLSAITFSTRLSFSFVMSDALPELLKRLSTLSSGLFSCHSRSSTKGFGEEDLSVSSESFGESPSEGCDSLGFLSLSAVTTTSESVASVFDEASELELVSATADVEADSASPLSGSGGLEGSWDVEATSLSPSCELWTSAVVLVVVDGLLIVLLGETSLLESTKSGLTLDTRNSSFGRVLARSVQSNGSSLVTLVGALWYDSCQWLSSSFSMALSKKTTVRSAGGYAWRPTALRLL